MLTTRQKYVLSTFSDIYDWENSEIIGYEDESQSPIRVFKASNDVFEEKTLVKAESVKWFSILNNSIPVLFHSDQEELMVQKTDHVLITFDLFKSVFYFLSGWQEAVSPVTDEYGRYPYEESIQAQLGFIETPVVNYYFHTLSKAIGIVSGSQPSPKKTSKNTYNLHLSHDIDLCQTGWKPELMYAIRKGRFIDVTKILVQKLLGKDPWWTFDKILNMESRYNVNSTFFFLTEKRTIDNIPHADYEISDPEIQQLLQKIIESGSEVMLHGSKGTSENVKQLVSEKENLNSKSNGNRFHFLCWDALKTPDVLEKAGIKYDYTVGFPERIGFRYGICHSFQLYNLLEDRTSTVLETPLAIMDTTLYNQRYMGICPEEAPKRLSNIIHQVKMFEGTLSILWHNNYFSGGKYEGWDEVYEGLIETLNT